MSSEQVYEAVEVARSTGKIVKGANETTKAAEQGKAEMIITAEDTSPKEIVMHLPMIAEEKKIKHEEVDSKEKLGAAAGLPIQTAAVAIVESGDAENIIESL